MLKVTRLIPFLLGLLLLLNSCGKNEEHTRYIPKDAVGVLSINTSSLFKKVLWNAVSGSPAMREMMQELGGKDTASFNPEEIGIKQFTTFYAYGVADQRFSEKARFMVIVPLADATKFQAFLKKKFADAKIESKDGFTFASLNQGSIIGWNKETAILAAASSGSSWDEQGNLQPAADNSAILKEEIQKAFALPKDQSLAGNDKFKALQNDGHDISFWLNYEMLANSMPQEQIGTAGAIMASQKKLLKDAFIAGGLDFEKGKIKGNATYYFNPSVKPLMEAMEVKSVNNDLLKRVPGNQMNVMLSYHFNPQGIKTLVDSMGMTPLANAGLKEVGLSLDEVLNAFTGDFLLAVTDFNVGTESASYQSGGSEMSYTKPVPNFKASLSFRVKDKAVLDKIIQLGVQAQALTPGAAPGTFSAGMVTLAVNNEFVAVSNDPAVSTAFLAGGNSNFSIPSDVKNSPYGFYADVKNSLKGVPLDPL